MNQKERMLSELPYLAFLDGLKEESQQAKIKCLKYNLSHPKKIAKRDKLIRKIVGKCGEKIYIEPPFHVDYGKNIKIGENFYSNFNCVMLDVATINIGDNVMFGPNVSVYTAGHPIHPDARNSGYEYGIGVNIGNNVWIGGNSVINPGVKIGDNVVIGSGSVVTKDIPANVVAAGNPCKVIREIVEEDKYFYYKDRKFDIEWK